MTGVPPPSRSGSSVVLFEGARRNANALGSLQLGGRREYDFEGSVRADPPGTQRSTGLARTGISRLPVVRWYHGELSGELALREVLDAVESCVGAEHRERRELVDAVRLYGQTEDILGGPVGAAVGGVPLSPLTISAKAPPVASGLWAVIFSLPPDVAMRTALAWVTGADVDEQRAAAAGAASLPALRKALAGLTAEEANLEFKRACLATHPKRPGGRLHEHVATHVHFELVRHCWETCHPALFAAPRGGLGRDGPHAGAHGRDGEDAGGSEAASDALAEAAVRACLEYDLKLTDSALLPPRPAPAEPEPGAEPAPAGVRPLVPPLPGGMGVKEYNARVERYLSHLCAVRDELAEEVERLQHSGAFATLGADPSASTAELTKQYRTQAKRLHPDRNGGDKRAFQELQQAYETIMQERKAAQADEDGSGSGSGSDEEEEEAEAGLRKTAAEGLKPAAGSAGGAGAEGAAGEQGEGAGADGGDDQNEAPNASAGGVQASGAPSPKKAKADAAPADSAASAASAGAPAAAAEEEELEPALAPELAADPAVAELLSTLRAGKADAEAAASRASNRQGARATPAADDDAEAEAEEETARAAPHEGEAGADSGARRDGADADASTEGVYIGGVRAPAALPSEAASEHAELAAEHASMCTRSSKIAASVAQASKAGGRGGSSVLLSAAGLILDCAEKSATHARRAGSAAASAPAAVMPTLHGLCASQLSAKEEKAVRKLMSVVLGAAAAGEASLEAVAELELSTGKNVRESLALMRAHASTPVANVAGPLAAQMLAQVGKAAVRCAEAAMAAAMALADLQHRIDKVFTPPENGGSASRRPSKPKRARKQKGCADKGKDGAVSEEEGEEGKRGAKGKKGGGGEEGDDDDDGADGAKGKPGGGKDKPGGDDDDAGGEGGGGSGGERDAPPQNADERRLLENRQLLLKLNGQVVQAQLKVKGLLAASPGLIVAVSEAQKEALFALLAESIGDAESRLARRWYEAGCGERLSVREWTRQVLELTAFVRHGADAEKVAVPYALSARLLREAALVDSELLCCMVRKELFDKVLLLSPDAKGPEDELLLRKLAESFDETVRRLKLSAAGVSV